MLINFLSALALVLVFEGILPFAFPDKWKQLMLKISFHDEKILRIYGFVSMLAGVLLLTIVHQFAE